MFNSYYMQDYLAEIHCYAKSIGSCSRDSSTVIYNESQLSPVDSEFSSSKKRSKSAKNTMMGHVVKPSMQELLDSIPEARYMSKRAI
jgi:hypothetical protein